MEAQPPWRLQLLARLAAERSFLLRQLWALNVDMLTTKSVSGGRTVKDIIAHVAAWDSLVLSRLRMVGNGRVHQIEPLGVGDNRNTFNAELQERYQPYSLKLTLAFALRERSNLLYAFSQLADKELECFIHLPWGEEIQLRDWFVQQYKHDAFHAQEIAAWRKTLPLPAKRQIGPKLVLRAILKAARKEVLTLVDLVPMSNRDTITILSDWTLKDLVGHLADWEQTGVTGLSLLLVGKNPEFKPIDDFAVFNEAGVVARRHQSWQQVWRTFSHTRKALEDTFQQFPEPFMAHKFVAPWGKEMPTYFWLSTLFGHDYEHAIDIRRALNIPGLPDRLTQQYPLAGVKQ